MNVSFLSIVTMKVLEHRINSLKNKGEDICKSFKSDQSSSFNTLTCEECKYTSDVHLLRDILRELEGKQ